MYNNSEGFSSDDMIIEAGTNELQIMEFKVGDRNFGINVAKVLEIMQYEEVTPMPHTSPYVEGVFKPRDKIITVIDLAKYLDIGSSKDPSKDIVIITNFNNQTVAFHVHSVELIRRISWKDLEKPDRIIYNDMDTLTVGIVRAEDRLITVIDFEKILADITKDSGFDTKQFEEDKYKREITSDIFVVEDSKFLSDLLVNSLKKAGYINISLFNNGQEAWDKLKEIKEKEKPYNEYVSGIITDIEMPQMDGYTLIKNIKEDKVLNEIPIIVFSSLITDDIKEKGEKLGADAQISKPEIGDLVDILDSYIIK